MTLQCFLQFLDCFNVWHIFFFFLSRKFLAMMMEQSIMEQFENNLHDV